MDPLLLEFLLLSVLIAANGLFAMAELAVISARKVRLERLADAGVPGARVALDLAGAPGRFLATIQVGITLIGILAGAIGGVTLAARLDPVLTRLPVIGANSRSVAVGLVVVGITLVTLVMGELVPKRIALIHPERIAARLAPLMRRLARLASPFVQLLNACTEGVTRLLQVRAPSEPPVTEEDIRGLIHRGTVLGVFEPAEREMVERVFSLADRTVGAVMTPYPDVKWLDVADEPAAVAATVTDSGHSRFPVVRDSRDHVLGIAGAKDLLRQALAGQTLNVAAVVQPALLVPAVTPVLLVLERFREEQTTVALVIDEYGSLQGMVTATDLLEALVGELPEATAKPAPLEVVRRRDGSWLLDGALAVDEVRLLLGVADLPGEPERHVGTLGGLLMAELGRIPAEGERVEWRGWTFEVVDMDGRRVDKVLVIPPGGRAEVDAAGDVERAHTARGEGAS
jgi:putative hemolysin